MNAMKRLPALPVRGLVAQRASEVPMLADADDEEQYYRKVYAKLDEVIPELAVMCKTETDISRICTTAIELVGELIDVRKFHTWLVLREKELLAKMPA